jgi:hypothetical protein
VSWGQGFPKPWGSPVLSEKIFSPKALDSPRTCDSFLLPYFSLWG